MSYKLNCFNKQINCYPFQPLLILYVKQNQKICFKVKFIAVLISAVYWTQNMAKQLTKKEFSKVFNRSQVS